MLDNYVLLSFYRLFQDNSQLDLYMLLDMSPVIDFLVAVLEGVKIEHMKIKPF